MAQSSSYLIKFGADADSVTKAINGINTDMRTLQKVASNADKAFKLTGDTSQLDTKLSALQRIIEMTEDKAATLRVKLADMTEANGGEMPQTAQAKKLSNQLTQTESDAVKFKAQLQAVENTKAGEGIASGMGKAEKSIEGADNATSRLHDGLTKSGVALGSFVGNLAGNLVSTGLGAIGNLFSGMVGDITDASDSLSKFQQTMSFAGKSDKEIKKVTDASKVYADQTVYDLNTVLNTTAQLGANGVKNYDQLVQASGNLNSVVGGNADTFKSVAMVLTQTAGAGKLTTENWNQLSDAIPGASGKLQEAMKKNGAFTGNFRDAMEKGQISADEFNKAVMDLGMTDVAKKAATSTKTIEGAVGNLQAAFVTQGTAILDSIKGPITDAMGFVAESVPKVSKMLGGMFSGLGSSGLGDVFIAPLKEMFNSLKSIDLGPIMKQFGGIGTALKNTLGELKLDGLKAIGSQIMPALVAGFQNFMNAAGPAIEKVMGAFKNLWNALEPVRQLIANTLVPVFKILGSYLGGMLSGALDVVSTGFNALAKVFDFLSPAIQFIEQLFLALAPTFEKVAGWLGSLQGGFKATGAIFGAVGNVLSKIGSSIGSAFGSMGSALSGTFNNIRGAFSSVGNLFSSVGNKIGGVAQSIVQWFSNIGGKIAGGFGNVVGAIAGKFSGVGSAISRAFGDLGSIGLNVVKGIASGITGGLSFIRGVIRDFVGNVTSFIKKLFKIHSPSRLMRDEVGTYITRGIAVGMTDRAAMTSINGAAGTVTSGVLGAFGGITNPGTLNGALATTGAFAQPTSNVSTANNSIVFNVSGTDPSRTAEQIRKVLRQEGLA